MNTRSATVTAAAALFGLAAGLLTAGPLDPPAGPVAATHKTLSEIEPRTPINAANTPGDADSLYRITQPGSYYLTGNIVGVPNKHTIEIAASHVSIDLCGFAIDNQTTPGSNNFFGIILDNPASPNHITVRNGTVRNCGAGGAYLVYGQGSGFGYTVEHVQFARNAFGISTAHGSIIRHCRAYENTTHGISVVEGVIENCQSSFNDGAGILLQRGTITACRANGNDNGGIRITNGTASGCTTGLNSAGGIHGQSSIIEGCHATDGIRVSTRSVARNNTCSNFQNTAMQVSGNDNHIEGNTFTGSTFGLAVLDPGNIIIRNTASGNTLNWSIIAGNALAPIVQASTNAANANGNTYTGNLGNTDPNANFTF